MIMLRKILISALLAIAFISVDAKVSKHTADSIADMLNKREAVCNKTCPLYESENPKAGIVNTLFIDVLAIIGTVWLYSNYKKKYFIGIGVGLVVVVTGSLLLRGNNKSEKCIEYEEGNYKVFADAKKPAADGGLSDFQQMDSTVPASPSTPVGSDFSNISSTDTLTTAPTAPSIKITDAAVLDPLIAFVLIALIGICIRYKSFVRYRGLFMLAGVAWFGFYRGGCDCMISSFQSLVIGAVGWKFVIVDMAWIIALAVATYFFGRVWCGWLCHLGGVQDFLFHAPKLKILAGARSQKYLRITRYIIFALWIVQLLMMRKNIFCEYDPFRALFNMIFTDWLSVALLILLLVSSVLIYRPFCRAICPVGVILGWISLLPGARRMRMKKECVNCGLCSKDCAMHALSKTADATKVDTENCIACGECITICRKGGIKNDVK
jgi:NAD-dependent dihydropyrimidine dehydrogenase PreA subunit